MVSTKPITALQHFELPDANDVTPISQKEMECLEEVRTVLTKYGAIDRFGVCLLHKHFDVAEDEILLEVCDAEGRILTARPVKKSSIKTHDVIETNWYLGSLAATGACTKVCVQTADHKRDHDSSYNP